MKCFKKIIALVMVITIVTATLTTASAMFAPSSNQAGPSAFVGKVVITTDVPAHEDNKLIVTLPDADLSGAYGGELNDGVTPLLVDTVDVDDVAKTITFNFTDYVHPGKMLVFTLNNVVNTAGTHPYTVEIYSGDSDSTTEIENDTYTISDTGITVTAVVNPFILFGLTTNEINLVLDYGGGNTAEGGRAVGWTISTNAAEYAVSARLRSDFVSGTTKLPQFVPDGLGEYIPAAEMRFATGVYIGNFYPGHPRGNNMLIQHNTPLTTEKSVLLTTGALTNMDTDTVNITIRADGKTPVGTYIGVIEFTATASF